MKPNNSLPGRIKNIGATVLLLLAGNVNGWTQVATPASPQQAASPATPPADAMTDAVRQLQDEVRELRTAVGELRSEAGQYRAETEALMLE